MDLIKDIFSSNGFMPHGHCFLWRQDLLALHIVSDALIAISYYTIPIALVYFVKKRTDVPFGWMFWLFSLFILACGTTHLFNIWTFWFPHYWISGIAKLITAIVSVLTAISMIPMMPKALAIPSNRQLELVNQDLLLQIQMRKKAESKLREYQENLEEQIKQRTQELQASKEEYKRVATDLNKAQAVAKVGSWKWFIQEDKLLWSGEMYRIFGIPPQSFSGNLQEVIQRAIHPDDRAKVEASNMSVTEKGIPVPLEYRIILPNGNITNVWAEAGEIIFDENSKPLEISGIVQDITERKMAEEKILQTLHEKEILIRELYHRTKNTMQVIRSMLMLQAAEFPANDALQQVVKNTENRIQAISVVHQMLYTSQNLSQISIKEYVSVLSSLIVQSFNLIEDQITLKIEVVDQHFLLDTAIPFGLILNELMTNSLKYAFPDNRKGIITISLQRQEPNKYIFEYSDNGIGVSDEFDFRQQNSLGLKLIFSIAEMQMLGSIDMKNENGISCHFEFSDNLYKARV